MERLYQEFRLGGQTSNEHAVNNHTTEKMSLCHEPWTMGRAQGERFWKARDRKEMRRQGVACTVTGMHGNSDVRAGKPFPSLHTYFKDLLLHTKGGEEKARDQQGAGGSGRKEIERF